MRRTSPRFHKRLDPLTSWWYVAAGTLALVLAVRLGASWGPLTALAGLAGVLLVVAGCCSARCRVTVAGDVVSVVNYFAARRVRRSDVDALVVRRVGLLKRPALAMRDGRLLELGVYEVPFPGFLYPADDAVELAEALGVEVVG